MINVDIMKSTTLGFTMKEWASAYKLFIHDKEKNPKDLWEVFNYYNSLPSDKPDEVIAKALKLIACEKLDGSPVNEMVREVLIKGK